MNSPLVKIFAVVLGWPLAVLFVLVAIEWYRDHLHDPTIPPPNRERVQHPLYHHTATQALDKLAALPASERRAVVENLKERLRPLAAWQPLLHQGGLGKAGLGKAGWAFLCLGEDHDEYTRRFLAEHLLPEIEADVLFLEATRRDMASILRRAEAGEVHVSLLEADIAAVIRAARARNPSLAVLGIEETKAQRKARRQSGTGSRDESIVANLMEGVRAGRRHVILFGALHCKDQPGWLYDLARDALPELPPGAFLNLRVLSEHRDGPLEAFVYFLDESGLGGGDFVITDADTLHPRVKRWFSLLYAGMLSRFSAVVVFRP